MVILGNPVNGFGLVKLDRAKLIVVMLRVAPLIVTLPTIAMPTIARLDRAKLMGATPTIALLMVARLMQGWAAVRERLA